MHLSDPPPSSGLVATSGAPANQSSGTETCRFPKLEECAHFHYERVQLPHLEVVVKADMEVSLHSQHSSSNLDNLSRYYTLQVTSRDECWLIQRSLANFAMLDAQLHQCIYDRKVSQLPDLTELLEQQQDDFSGDLEMLLSKYLEHLFTLTPTLLNCGPILNWFQLDNRGHRLLVPSEESRSINTPAVAAAYSVRRYVAQARDELSLEVGDMISVIDMASPGESVWWRGKRGFQVGFFPQWCVCIIGEKVPRNVPVPPPVVGSLAISPIKPVLRKHGKLITFFRSFILNRPSRRRLKQSGILKERVFGCDLGEHLLNSGLEIPMVLKCCAEFIEAHGIVDGIYRLSGVTSNIQKLRNAFDEDKIPNLYTDDILQDIHSVASLLKMYFRELPNPLCTYQLYQSFVQAVQGCSVSRNKANDNERLLKMREAVQKLPPPHYRTLEYLMRHLALISTHGHNTGMTTRNLAIVWAPNLLRCEELEVGGVAALQGVGVQAVVTEFLICYADLIFSDKLPANLSDTVGLNNLQANHLEVGDYIQTTEGNHVDDRKSRPKSLAISTPTKLLTLEEARNKHLLMKDEGNYIEVGGGPKSLPKKYHTVIELPAGSRKRNLSKRSPSGWRSFFSKSRNSSHGNLTKREISSPGIIPIDKSVTESDLNEIKRKLRPVKSAESLTSGQSEPAICEADVLGPLHCLSKPPGHNRSVSHDSYFDNLQCSTNNSIGSLLDLSEIQLNFELEESEMRIFSEDESLVSSPKVQKEGGLSRKALSRARPEDFSSATNSSNPSPKKQPRVVISPDSLSRKRSRLEDQLSDIQYIDCNTPDNTPCLISTTALIHNDDCSSTTASNSQLFEGYPPKNKSSRNSATVNRYSLNFEKVDKVSLPKSYTDVDLKRIQSSPTPDSPNYKPLNESSCTNTPILSPTIYENGKPNYENILTTISIIYKSPTKTRNSDNIYEDIELNPEKAVIPTTVASLPIQEASQPELDSKKLLETSFDESIITFCSDSLIEQNTDNKEMFVEKQSKANDANLEITYQSIDSISSALNSPNSHTEEDLILDTQTSMDKSVSSQDLTFDNSLNAEDIRRQNFFNDKRKSCEVELLDENAIYQQVKYFRRSIHEINSLLDISEVDKKSFVKSKSVNNSVDNLTKIDKTFIVVSLENKAVMLDSKIQSNISESAKTPENFDSLEAENIHLYENVPESRSDRCSTKDLDLSRSRMHESEPKKLDIAPDVVQELPVCSKCSPDIEQPPNVKDLMNRFENQEKPEEKQQKPKLVYDKDGLPPCLRAKNAKNSIKTRSLDENAFEVEFGKGNFQRRKSLDDRMHSYIIPEQPKGSSSTTDIRFETQTISKQPSTLNVEQKLNRERIEKYKEERRNFLREKYRSESFREDKDKILLRLKQKSNSKSKIDEFVPTHKTSNENCQLSESPKDTVLFNIDTSNRLSRSAEDEEIIINRVAKLAKDFQSSTNRVFNDDNKPNETPMSNRFFVIGDKNQEVVDSKILNDDSVTSQLSKSPKNLKIAKETQAVIKDETNVNCLRKLSKGLEYPINKSTKEDTLNSRLSKSPKESELLKNLLPNKEGPQKEMEFAYSDPENSLNRKIPMETLSKFEKGGAITKNLRKKTSPNFDKRNRPSLREISDIVLDESSNDTILLLGGKEDEFLRHRRGDSDSERRRHTYDLLRERDLDSESSKRMSFDSKNPRKEKCSPSYCIKDMKAIFESKLQQ